jgi:hypothetical protein
MDSWDKFDFNVATKTLCYITVRRNRPTYNTMFLLWCGAGQFELSTHSVFDDGDIDHLDIYSFEPIDPDEPFQIRVFTTLDEALTFILDNHKLTDLRFVNEGVIQNEYKGLKEKDNV